MSDPTRHEIETCSDNPTRFKRMLPTAQETLDYAAAHAGRLPPFVFQLSDAKWRDLSATLRELDDLAWLRGVAA